MSNKDVTVKSRNEQFTSRAKTKIWKEVPSEDNPYVAEDYLCHGYDIFELASKKSFIDIIYLLFKGELPSTEQKQLLEQLMILFINPGPRHPATQAGMNAGISRCDYSHILPIALSVHGGEHLGGKEVELAMRFLSSKAAKNPSSIADDQLTLSQQPAEGDWHPAPGFGSRFGSIDIITQKMAKHLCDQSPSNKYLKWGSEFATELTNHNMGWLATGVTAAALLDLGFEPREGAGLFQLISAPGLLAHSMEMANKPLTAMPFLDSEHYVITKK